MIGLTGGMASGKSTVARMMEEMGAAVIDADVVAREVVEPGGPAWRELVEAFGPSILNADGHLDRRALARLAFADAASLDKLNRATHPHIIAAIRRRLAALAAAGTAVAVIDAALLFETGLAAEVDQVWVVTARREQQIARARLRDALEPEEVEARLASQWPIEDKVMRADVVIDNSGTLPETRRQVEAAWRRIAE